MNEATLVWRKFLSDREIVLVILANIFTDAEKITIPKRIKSKKEIFQERQTTVLLLKYC